MFPNRSKLITLFDVQQCKRKRKMHEIQGKLLQQNSRKGWKWQWVYLHKVYVKKKKRKCTLFAKLGNQCHYFSTRAILAACYNSTGLLLDTIKKHHSISTCTSSVRSKTATETNHQTMIGNLTDSNKATKPWKINVFVKYKTVWLVIMLTS